MMLEKQRELLRRAETFLTPATAERIRAIRGNP